MSIKAKGLEKNFFKPYRESFFDSEHLNIEVVSASYFECSEEWDLEARRINDSYWTWIIAGQGCLCLGDEKKEYIVKKGDFILFPQYHLHSLKPDAGSAMSMINVHFHARLYDMIDMVAHYNLGGVYKDSGNKLFESNSYEAAREYCLKPSGWKGSIVARIQLLLLDLIRNQENPPEQESKILRLRPVLALIESNLSDPNLSVADMAAEMDMSEVYLRTLFRRQFGISPIKYLRLQRINQACTLLRKTLMTIALISEKCGFREVQFFHRVFREIIGITPGNYRKNPVF